MINAFSNDLSMRMLIDDRESIKESNLLSNCLNSAL